MGRTVAFFDVVLPPLPQPNDITQQHLKVLGSSMESGLVDFLVPVGTSVLQRVCVLCGQEVTIELRYSDRSGNMSQPRVMKFTVEDRDAPPMPAEFTISTPVFEIVDDADVPADPAVDPAEPEIVTEGDESGEVGTETPPEVIE